MPHRKRRVKIFLAILGAVILVIAISGVNLLLDVRRIGCESGGQLLGPASTSGLPVSLANQPGACFISLVEVQEREIKIARVICSNRSSFTSCHTLREQEASGWTDFFGTKCTSVSFIGNASCDCVETGNGCQKGAWHMETAP